MNKASEIEMVMQSVYSVGTTLLRPAMTSADDQRVLIAIDGKLMQCEFNSGESARLMQAAIRANSINGPEFERQWLLIENRPRQVWIQHIVNFLCSKPIVGEEDE